MSVFIKMITMTLMILILGYFALNTYQEKMLYPGTAITATLESYPNNLEKIELPSNYAYLLKPSMQLLPQQAARFPLIIYTHGNGEIIDMWVDKFDYLLDKGIAILLVEYPGYGDASGKPSLISIEQAVLEAYDNIVLHPQINSNQIVAYGRSMGGAAAALLANKRDLSALGLESTFASLEQLIVEYGYPGFILRDKYVTDEIVTNLNIPIYLYHGTEDNVIPFSHTQTLNNLAKNVTFYSNQCGHNNCPAIWDKFVSFLNNKAGFSN